MARTDIMSNEFISDSESDNEMEQTFKVPSDFKKCDHLKKFPLDKLTKKSEEEVWLINIPGHLDISKLETLPIDFKRTSSVTVDKQTYEIEQEKNKDNSNLVIMVPESKRDSLKILTKQDKPLQFDKIFTISESTDIPDINYERVRTERENVPVVEGLITRHFATGYNAADFGISETSNMKKRETTNNVVAGNNETENYEHSKKRHHHHKEEGDEAPSKKKKKEKKDKKHKKDKKKEHK